MNLQLTPRFNLVQGDILRDRGIPFIPVNCQAGVMGAGLAKVFVDHYPDLRGKHIHAVNHGALMLRKPAFAHANGRHFILFPTKGKWRYASKIDWIMAGLANLSIDLEEAFLKDTSVGLAIPALGCGLGGLPWEIVAPVVQAWSYGLPARYTVNLYAPQDDEEELL